ncbi:MAG TPA: MFS transporter, partial [Symbiobacteriaceae bacterium]|nr:MFS transporter [Symbiobacteriaceae bacterium]
AGIVSFITLFALERKLDVGLFFFVYAAAMTLTRPLAGRIQDRKGPGLVMATGLVALMAGFLLLSASESVWLFGAAAALLGVGNGNVMPTTQAMAINLVSPQRRGVASSTLFSAQDLGMALGSTALGWVADTSSMAVMYTVSGMVLVAPLVLFFLYVRPYYGSKVAKVSHG